MRDPVGEAFPSREAVILALDNCYDPSAGNAGSAW